MFVDQWLSILFAEGPEQTTTSQPARRLIVQARSSSSTPAPGCRTSGLWNSDGASRARQLDFRWGNASTLLADIHTGLGNGGDYA